MTRARMIGGLLAAILLACVVVIFLDQQGMFGGSTSTTSAPTQSPTQAAPAGTPAPTPQPANNSGFGGLK